MSAAPTLAPLAPASPPSAPPLEGIAVLLGGEADASLVPELAAAGEPALVLLLSGGSAPDPASLGLPAGATALHLAPLDVHDLHLAERVRGARTIALGAGTLSEWFMLLYPRRERSALVEALYESWRGGATLVGRGEIAALLSAATVVDGPGELTEPECNPRLEGPRVAWALGMQPYALLDTAERSDGRLERLATVLTDERLRLGAWLGPRAALVADTRGRRLVARGEGAVVLLDARGSRGHRNLREARLSVLRAGDAWSRRSRAVEPAGDVRRAEVGRRRRELEVADVLDAGELLEALAELETRPVTRELVLRDGGGREMVVVVDEDAGVYARAGGEATLDRLRVDLRWR